VEQDGLPDARLSVAPGRVSQYHMRLSAISHWQKMFISKQSKISSLVAKMRNRLCTIDARVLNSSQVSNQEDYLKPEVLISKTVPNGWSPYEQEVEPLRSLHLHLRFLVVNIMDPKWWSSIRLLICGVTSCPSQPIMNSWPMALYIRSQ
jgi:hypothetical protein